MTLIAFELSGEHPEIPAAEVVGALEAEQIDFSISDQWDQLLIISTDNENIQKMDILAGRLAMTWHIIEVLGISDADLPDITAMVESMDLASPLSRSYVVRAKKIKRKSPISSEDIERGIGRVLYHKGYLADLKEPDIRYRAVLVAGKCIFGRVLADIDRSSFEARNPQNKPFFYPGVLMPRLGRALVNIGRVRNNDIVLDPYCGTGGILIEAGLMGAKVIGSDVQGMIIRGSTMNLDFYAVKYSLLLQDAGNLALKDCSINCILTDPPYGRSALIQAQSLEELMSRSLCEMHRVLRPGRRMVLVSECPVEEWAEAAGFSVGQVLTQRVHRSLTRRITVLDKY